MRDDTIRCTPALSITFNPCKYTDSNEYQWISGSTNIVECREGHRKTTVMVGMETYTDNIEYFINLLKKNHTKSSNFISILFDFQR